MATVGNFSSTPTAQSKDGGAALSLYTVWNAGDVLVIVTAGDAGASSIYNTAGLTFSAVATATNSGNVVTTIWVAVAASNQSPAASLTCNWGTGGYARTAAGYRIQGLTNASFDKASTGTGSGTSPSSGATETLTSSDSVAIGGVGIEDNVEDIAGSWTTGSSNVSGTEQQTGTTGGGGASNIVLRTAAEVLSATTAQTAALTSIASADWAAAVATFKSVQATARLRSLLGVGL